MIAGVGRHARTRRESRALVTHLLKEENSPRVRVLGGTLATDLPGAVRDMGRLRDSTSADAAALHIHLSPSRALTDDELARAAEIVRDHLGAADHPAAFVVHDKERRAGGGHSHAHLVLGRVSPSGKVLESGFEKIKLETASRLIEFELGEAPVLGRHHKSAVRWLRNNGREDVADWLEAAYGPDTDKPMSAASPDKRQALARRGIDLSDARAEICGAWKDGGAEAIRSTGYDIKPGRKSGVWIVAREGVEIGSLDRIVGEKRADVRNAIEAAPVQISRKERISVGDQSPRKPVQRDSGPVVGDPSSKKSEKFRPERSGLGPASAPLRGKKKTGAEQVSEAAADQARRLAETFGGHLDAAFTKASANRWIKERRTTLKGQILESSQSPDNADARREVARSRRELAVLDAASDALRADPSLAYSGEKALMGAARCLHAERLTATLDEIRTAWASGGAAAIRDAGFEIAPGRDGAWRIHRDGVPLGRLHRLIGERAADVRSAMHTDLDQISRHESNYGDTQPPRKSIELPSESPAGDTSSGTRRPRRSPEDAVAAANSFLDRLDADLRSKITELACPDKLPEPAELSEARRRLADVAHELATWDAQYGSRITELRLRTAVDRPMGFFAWISGATNRYDAASRDLAVLSDERDLLLKPVAAIRREVRILRSAQESRQAVHDDARSQKRERLSKNLSLVPAAREALVEDPRIALGGPKALAAAARQRRPFRLAEERLAETALEGGRYGSGGLNAGR